MKAFERKKEIEAAEKQKIEVYNGKIFQVEQENFTLADGDHHYETVRHPGAVVMIPIDETGKLILIKQYRIAVNDILIEFPAGTIEKGEDPAETAARELQEEIYQKAESLEFLITMYPAPGICDEILYFYVAKDLTPSFLPSEDGAFLDIEAYTYEECLELLKEGQIQDGKTIAGLMYYEKLINS